jgi:hypothetical protein
MLDLRSFGVPKKISRDYIFLIASGHANVHIAVLIDVVANAIPKAQSSVVEAMPAVSLAKRSAVEAKNPSHHRPSGNRSKGHAHCLRPLCSWMVATGLELRRRLKPPKDDTPLRETRVRQTNLP